MASSPSSSGRFAPPAPRPERDRAIEDELERTRRQLKGVDVTAALLTLAVGSLGYLLVMALVDHWIMPHGLGFTSRVVACAVLVVAVVVYSFFRLLPLVIRRINPIYAAQTIEQSRPSLKNSIINFLLLRSHQSELAPVIYEAVQQRAASDLASAPTESAIDRSRLIKLGYVLVAIVALTAMYKVFSPKDPWRSMGRIVAPWANIAVPTRVRIEAVEPGDTQVFQDSRLKVSALIRGIGPDDPVTLFYSTADSQVVLQPIRMRLPEGSYRYSAELPDTSSGLTQDSTYYITAGDAISPVYQIHVSTSPTITVERVEYKYPAYTELEPRTVERQGDLQAIEGTVVILHARASHDIKKASVDFERDGKLDLPMQAHGRDAQVTFPLNLKDRQPEHKNYQLQFVNSHGEANSNPTMYHIEVIRDLPPEVAFVEPKVDPQQEIPLAERGGLGLRLVVEASDPDFKLQQVILHARGAGKSLPDVSLLEEKTGRAGTFRTSYVFTAKNDRYTPRAGDVIELWAEAVDNKTPEPNRTETPHLKIRIGSPRSQQDQLADARDKQRQPPEAPPPGADQQRQNGRDQQRKPGAPPENQPDQPPPQGERDQENAGQKRSAQQDGAQGAPPQDQRVDPDDPGKAIEKLNDEAEKQPPQPGEQQKPGNKEGPDKQNADQQNPGTDEQKPPEKSPEKQPKSGGGQGDSGKGQSGQGQQGQSGQGQQGKSQEGQSGQGQPGEKSDGQGKSSGKQPGQGQQQPGEKQESGQGQGNGQGSKPNGEQPNEGQSGGSDQKQSSSDDAGNSGRGQRSGQSKPADPQGGGKSGDQKGGENTPEGSAGGSGQPQQSSSGGSGGKQTGQGQPGQGKSSQGKSDQSSSGQGKSGDGQSGQGKPGQNQSGDGKAGDKQSGQGGGKSGSNAPGNKSPQSGGADQSGQQSSNQSGGSRQQSGRESKQGSAGQQPGSDQNSGNSQPGGKQSADKPKQTGGQQKPGSDAAGAKESDGTGQGQDSTGTKPQPGGKDSQGGKESQGKDSQGGKPQSSAGSSGDKQAAKPGEGAEKQAGQGSDSRESLEESDQQKPGSGQPQSKQPGGDRDNTSGSAGSGQSKRDDQGATSQQDSSQARNKQPGNSQSPGDSKDQQKSSDGNSPSRSERESNSSGDSSGDQSGGGKQGGGQKASKPGTGGAGKNTAADDGGSQAKEKGSGETSGKGGDKQPAGKPVDNAASQGQGPGSKSQPGNSTPGSEQAGAKGSEGGPQSDKQGEPSSGQGSGGVGNPTGGGPSDQKNNFEKQPHKEAPPGEDPNLEYARKATDLALEKLKDQLKKPAGDNAVLDKLGWTRADAERFVKRWEAMKQAAGQSGAEGDAARKQLNDALRNLGLRPRGTTISGARAGGDRQRNLREGLRTRPPAEYVDQYRAYTTGTSQAQKAADSGQPAAGSKP